MNKSKFNRIIISVLLTIFIVVLLVLAVARLLPPSVQYVVTPQFVSTPEQDEYTQEFMTYIALLEQEGLVTAKEIQVEGSHPFVFILRPQNATEITDEDVLNITDLALHTVSVFESGRFA